MFVFKIKTKITNKLMYNIEIAVTDLFLCYTIDLYLKCSNSRANKHFFSFIPASAFLNAHHFWLFDAEYESGAYNCHFIGIYYLFISFIWINKFMFCSIDWVLIEILLHFNHICNQWARIQYGSKEEKVLLSLIYSSETTAN